MLFVEGEKFNVSRFYVPPAVPNMVPQPGDVITYDQFGEPVINRPVRGIGFVGPKQGVPGSKLFVAQKEIDIIDYAQISPSQLKMEAEKGAVAAKRQLDDDVDMIKSINQERTAFNELVMGVAKDATGHDGKTPKEWRDSLPGKSLSKQPTEKPTFPEMVMLQYNPAFGPVGVTTQTLFKVNIYMDT